MDALSDVLKSVRLEGAVFVDAEFTDPWCLQGKFGLARARKRLNRAFKREFGIPPAAWRRSRPA